MTYEEAERAAYPDVERMLLNICEVRRCAAVRHMVSQHTRACDH